MIVAKKDTNSSKPIQLMAAWNSKYGFAALTLAAGGIPCQLNTQNEHPLKFQRNMAYTYHTYLTIMLYNHTQFSHICHIIYGFLSYMAS